MTAPPTQLQIAERKAIVRQAWCDDSGVIIPIEDRERPPLGHRCDYCGGPIPVEVISSYCGRCKRDRSPFTARVYAWLLANGPASVLDIANHMGQERSNTRRAVNAQQGKLFRLVAEEPRQLWEAIPETP